MRAAFSHHPTRLYNDTELYQAVINYLDNTYFFRRLEIEQWLGLNQIVFIRRNDHLIEEMAEKSPEDLWHDGDLQDWGAYVPQTVNNLYEDFMWLNMSKAGFKRKQLVKKMIRAAIEESELTVTMLFDRRYKALNMGREKVTAVKPLNYSSPKRQPVFLEEGEVCYLNYYSRSPFIANPAIVFKKRDNSYRLLFFTNMKDDTETSKLAVNTAMFLTVPADELGKTPKEAVLQRFC